MSTEVRCKYYSTIRERPVSWLWYPYIPYGKVTVLQGDPGEGKSTFMVNLAAALSHGVKLPDGSAIGGPKTVLYWSDRCPTLGFRSYPGVHWAGW